MSRAPAPVDDREIPGVTADAVDRALWERLRRAARRGHLQPEGFALVDELHARYPHWRAQW